MNHSGVPPSTSSIMVRSSARSRSCTRKNGIKIAGIPTGTNHSSPTWHGGRNTRPLATSSSYSCRISGSSAVPSSRNPSDEMRRSKSSASVNDAQSAVSIWRMLSPTKLVSRPCGSANKDGRLFVNVTSLYLAVSSEQSLRLLQCAIRLPLAVAALETCLRSPKRALLKENSNDCFHQSERNLRIKSLRRPGQKHKEPVQEAR